MALQVRLVYFCDKIFSKLNIFTVIVMKIFEISFDFLCV